MAIRAKHRKVGLRVELNQFILGELRYPNNYKKLVLDYLDQNLKDPDSLKRLKINSPVAGKTRAGLVYGGKFYGYRSCVSYNAKNSYGGYTGLKTYSYWFKNGRVAFVVDFCSP